MRLHRDFCRIRTFCPKFASRSMDPVYISIRKHLRLQPCSNQNFQGVGRFDCCHGISMLQTKQLQIRIMTSAETDILLWLVEWCHKAMNSFCITISSAQIHHNSTPKPQISHAGFFSATFHRVCLTSCENNRTWTLAFVPTPQVMIFYCLVKKTRPSYHRNLWNFMRCTGRELREGLVSGSFG